MANADWVALAELWMRSYCPPMDAALMHQLAARTVSSLAAPSVKGATGSSSATGGAASSSEEPHGAAVAGQMQVELAALLGGKVPRGEATDGEGDGTERGCESVEKHCLQSLVDIHVSHGRCQCSISVTPELVALFHRRSDGVLLAVGRHTKFLVGPQRQSRAPVRGAGGHAEQQARQGSGADKQGDAGGARSKAVSGEVPLDSGLRNQLTLRSRL
ncbi:unnamed protein product [Closterium sp. Yama58-4]|nr:unnamed protein product [Closterium sp. Yama58-4]